MEIDHREIPTKKAASRENVRSARHLSERVKALIASGGRFIFCVLTPARKRWAIGPPRPGYRKLISAAMVMTDVHSSDVAAADEPAEARPSWELHRVGNLTGHTSRVFCTAFSPRYVAHLRTERSPRDALHQSNARIFLSTSTLQFPLNSSLPVAGELSSKPWTLNPLGTAGSRGWWRRLRRMAQSESGTRRNSVWCSPPSFWSHRLHEGALLRFVKFTMCSQIQHVTPPGSASGRGEHGLGLW